MRLSSLALAATLFVAAPAFAQNNATDNLAATPANVTAVNLTETNAETAATPAVTAPEPTVPTAPAPAKRSFPWGVLGVLGLIGLFGRKRSI